jgi:hypothetical protein
MKNKNPLFQNILEYPIRTRIIVHFAFGFLLNLPCSMLICILNEKVNLLIVFAILPCISGLSFTIPLIHHMLKMQRTIKRIISSFLFGFSYGIFMIYQLVEITELKQFYSSSNFLIAGLLCMLIPWGILFRGEEFPFDVNLKKNYQRLN